nr:hypothetical protein [Intestinimonas timonensis]
MLTNFQQLKMRSLKNGKRYATGAAAAEQLLRVIQSIHSHEVEPLKA